MARERWYARWRWWRLCSRQKVLEEEAAAIGQMSNNFCLIISYFLSGTCKCAVSVSTEWASVTTHAVTHTNTHTHTYTHIHTPITMMMVIWVDRCSESYCVFSVVHISNFFCFACISVHSFSQPSTSYVPAASLGVRIKYSPSTSRKESGHFRQESHEIFLSLWYVTGAQGKEGGSGS